MATPPKTPSRKPRRAIERFSIPPALVEHVLLGPTHDRRVLQDSPILGDVWLAYAEEPGSVQDLLITPHWEATAAEVAKQIHEPLSTVKGAKIAYLQGIVAARLTFEQVLRVLVPQTQWWRDRGPLRQLADKKEALYTPEALRDAFKQIYSAKAFRKAKTDPTPGPDRLTPLHRYLALAGLILWIGGLKKPVSLALPEVDRVLDTISGRLDEIVTMLLKLWDRITHEAQQREADHALGHAAVALIFQVSLNRPAMPALEKSVLAVKGDAARTLFNVSCEKIVWAVIDSGISTKHDAFMTREPVARDRKSRVTRTFNFTNIREIVSCDPTDADGAKLDLILAGATLGIDNRKRRHEEARDRLSLIFADAENGRPVNWDVIEELITLPDPEEPENPHGTHVAGIIGADQEGNGSRGDYAGGMCPDIRLYDFRVLGKTGEDTEFAIIAALQYIRYVNEKHGFIVIHGANLSLSIPHSVRNYACGRTPVCVECERLVNSGVVVVAAAGNRGYQAFQTKDGLFESYAAFSITDPGNGDGVITFGSTHGNWPHTYGVSFFSSRGPTGDGRQKPDLVAPGERVQSTVLGNQWGPESGTSMAAPHVSGAAAMLLARYPELVGEPRRVKRILCESATDLGRERSFQGHGMLDVLRAFQSI